MCGYVIVPAILMMLRIFDGNLVETRTPDSLAMYDVEMFIDGVPEILLTYNKNFCMNSTTDSLMKYEDKMFIGRIPDGLMGRFAKTFPDEGAAGQDNDMPRRRLFPESPHGLPKESLAYLQTHTLLIKFPIGFNDSGSFFADGRFWNKTRFVPLIKIIHLIILGHSQRLQARYIYPVSPVEWCVSVYFPLNGIGNNHLVSV